ncbi:hypothetical protein F4814DRAFT_418126 [Daldinia grandis]|nr:hypothetical protein F4814DRAFT_418126 [Daldinia grandis]
MFFAWGHILVGSLIRFGLGCWASSRQAGQKLGTDKFKQISSALFYEPLIRNRNHNSNLDSLPFVFDFIMLVRWELSDAIPFARIEIKYFSMLACWVVRCYSRTTSEWTFPRWLDCDDCARRIRISLCARVDIV